LQNSASRPSHPSPLQPCRKRPLLPPASTGLHHARPVRSGQQIYARGRDLTVAAAVGNGAEVIADGSIHIYGRLSGRALAGAQGDTTARIYCQDFQAELVSIAGHYRVLEDVPANLRGQAIQAWLDGERLIMERL
jgi:septum site-determining protein MinC